MTKPVQRRRLERVEVGRSRQPRHDSLVTEEPLEVRVEGRSFSVTMRTPGDDFDLVAGFLVSEGVVRSADGLAAMRYCAGAVDGDGGNTYNVIDASVTGPGALVAHARDRHVFTSSSCGLCGLASIEAVETASSFDVGADPVAVSADVLAGLPDALRAEQRWFDDTGGLHAAGLFDTAGAPLVVREDVGRHNAVDKVVGWALREDRLPLAGSVLQVSGRASFELVQKAGMAGIPVLAAVSAPSSLAVDLADRIGLTLVGFSRGGRFNVYTRGDRVAT
ncbi:formate dehydrogenase family accessory protein FdhD [Aeromicrobium marinum DSM 15272]|uniref:Sulfur carrier protein FdhD n=1 Tax=Aeromicrobium marinum DSM 15272 TaxID=585531 RepID=E2SDA6_9ACTN|nr:formate dehydrogenase accessory sulfurtransferase FdhD [Aeromicrobium marinum]EFQ82483.1 formate dehydrogenase family accessory protein FdhD [Aeromicrobium marinum DSM 15272]